MGFLWVFFLCFGVFMFVCLIVFVFFLFPFQSKFKPCWGIPGMLPGLDLILLLGTQLQSAGQLHRIPSTFPPYPLTSQRAGMCHGMMEPSIGPQRLCVPSWIPSVFPLLAQTPKFRAGARGGLGALPPAAPNPFFFFRDSSFSRIYFHPGMALTLPKPAPGDPKAADFPKWCNPSAGATMGSFTGLKTSLKRLKRMKGNREEKGFGGGKCSFHSLAVQPFPK